MIRFTALVVPLLFLACGETKSGAGQPWLGIVRTSAQPAKQVAPALSQSVALVLIGDVKVGGGQWTPRVACTGTLIAPDLILTAAHCLVPSEKSLGKHRTLVPIVTFHNLKTLDDDVKHDQFIVQSFKTHPKFGPLNGGGIQGMMQNDLALLRLANPISGVAPMKIQTVALEAGTDVKIAGFGEGGKAKPSYTLQSLETKVSPVTKQVPASGTEIIVANGDVSGLGEGDSGGPGYVEKDGALALWGVASGFGVAGKVNYSFFEVVGKNLDWLHSAAKELGSESEF